MSTRRSMLRIDFSDTLTATDYIATVALLLPIALLLNCWHPLNGDEGVTLTGAWNMLHGKHLYVDFFQYEAPGAYIYTWISFLLFGATYWSAKVPAIALLSGSGVAVAFVAQRLGARGPSCFGAALAWIVFASLPGIIVNHNSLSAFVAAIALASTVYACDAPDRFAPWPIAGLTTGLVPIFHQSKGLFLIASMAIPLAVIVSRKHVRATFVVALLAAMAVPLVTVCLVWSPQLLYERVVAWPSHHYLHVGPVGPLPFVAAAILFAALALPAWRSEGARSRDRAALSLVLAAQSGLLLSSISRSDVDHILFNVFPLCALAARVFDDVRAQVRRRWAVVMWSVLAVMIAWRTATNYQLSAARLAILDALRAKAITRFYAEPFVPQLYFELGADNPYPYSHVLTSMYTDDQFAATVTILERERPPFVLRNRSTVENFHYDWSNQLDRWIDEHYARVDEIGNLEILAPRAPP